MGRIAMKDWLREYSLLDLSQFHELLIKTKANATQTKKYAKGCREYPEDICDVCFKYALFYKNCIISLRLWLLKRPFFEVTTIPRWF